MGSGIRDSVTALWDRDYGCAESMLYGLLCGVDDAHRLAMTKLAAGFAGGIGHSGERICGAVAGAIMYLGYTWAEEEGSRNGTVYGEQMKAPRLDIEGQEDVLYGHVRQLLLEFESQFGFLSCGELRRDFASRAGNESFNGAWGNAQVSLCCRNEVLPGVERIVRQLTSRRSGSEEERSK